MYSPYRHDPEILAAREAELESRVRYEAEPWGRRGLARLAMWEAAIIRWRYGAREHWRLFTP